MANEENDPLLEKEEAELKRLKLAEEIRSLQEHRKSAEARDTSEKRKHRTELLKFIAQILLAPLIAAAITLGSGFLKSESEKNNRTLDFISKLEIEFSKANPENKTEIACQIGQIDSTGDEEINAKVRKYARICLRSQTIQDANNKVIADLQDRKHDLAKEQTLSAIDSMDLLLKQQNQKLKITTDKNKISQIQNTIIAITSQKTNAEKSADPELKKAGELITKNNQEQIAALQVENHAKAEIEWFKVGYFLTFGNISISLIEIDETTKNISVNIYDDASNPNQAIHENVLIKFDDSFTFKDKQGQTYKIELMQIGPAGKNPFKPAAYIAFTKL
jgi:hypothetical protein